MTDPALDPRERHRLEAAAQLVLLERLARRGLRAALHLPLRLLLMGAGISYVESAMRARGRDAILTIRSSAEASSRRHWETIAGMMTIEWISKPFEEARATKSASALADAWRKKVQLAQDDGLSDSVAARRASKELGPSIERTAVTETVDAWNQETKRQNDHAESRGFLVTETWNAALDRRTCPRCDELHGTSVDRPERFEEYPPLHPLCRCLIDTIILPR